MSAETLGIDRWDEDLRDLPHWKDGAASGSDGVRLHYSSYGRGDPALVCCNGIGVSTFFWRYVARYFAATRRVVTWDYRGHNRSTPADALLPDRYTIEKNAQDLAAVMDANRVERAVLLGHSMGCQVILEFWKQFPDRVAGLIPICGPYGHALDRLGPPAVMHAMFTAMHEVATRFPKEIQNFSKPLLSTALPFHLARAGSMINPQHASWEDMRSYFEHIGNMDIRVFFTMGRELIDHDAGPWLGDIDAPTLVVGAEADMMTPLELSKEMQERIPDAELLVLPKGSHAGLIEHPELLNLRIEKFLHERVESRPVRKKPAGKKRPAAKKKAPARKKAAAKKKAPARKKAAAKKAPARAARAR